MIHRDANFSRQDPDCDSGDTFIGCNLAQATPHTSICSGARGLRFVNCNLTNCDVPDDAVIDPPGEPAQVVYDPDGSGVLAPEDGA